MPTLKRLSWLSPFADKRMLIIFCLGFSSGLPLALTGSTLQAWLTESKLDTSTIGLFALVGLPYTLKFLWAPILDRYAIPFLGIRRGWGVVSQIGLCLSILFLALIDPVQRLDLFSLAAFCVAFFSASQDVVVDAYRTEILNKEAFGLGAGIATTGYRVATLVSGGIALILADHFSWTLVYFMMAAVNTVGIIALLVAPEPQIIRSTSSLSLRESVINPFLEFIQRSGAMEILLFVMIYKLSTLMATALTTTFLLELGYSKTLIGTVNKGAGLFASIAGTLAGGTLMVKLGLKRSLWIFGLVQSLVGLTFWALPYVASWETGWREGGLIAVVCMDQFMMGLGTAAIMGFMMTVCSLQFTGTQYALLSSLTAVTRVILVAHAGTIVKYVGWSAFYLGTVPLAIPGLLLLRRFDQWQKSPEHSFSDEGDRRRVPPVELSVISLFLISLVALSSDPFWRWLGEPEIGQKVIVTGAVGIVILVMIGVLRGSSSR